jgi:hypothetical protein
MIGGQKDNEQKYKRMERSNANSRSTISGATKRVLLELLRQKGQPTTLAKLTTVSSLEATKVAKIVHVLKGVGLVDFREEDQFVYAGTSSAIFKFLKFAKRKVRQYEADMEREESESQNSSSVRQTYNFRPPKIGLKGFALQADYVKQIVMEMLFDTSRLTRQIHEQELH